MNQFSPQPQMMPQQDPMMQPQMAQPGAEQSGYDPAMMQNQGPQPTENIGFNQEMQNILWSRVQQMNEQEVNAIDAIINEQTFPVLAKLFPELIPLFEQASMFDAQPEQGPIQGGGAQQVQPAQNPMTSDGLSRGLVG